ncbi:PIR protein [Plasmodium ovale]|uniref:PIR protein n=1 Tax=Plasmodium ovale TaxID=36330 RepID=A0A1C3KHV3_PLAOA|nr:PIR protein [Plasmodium ovale]
MNNYNYVYSFPECKADFERITNDESVSGVFRCTGINKDIINDDINCIKFLAYLHNLENEGTSSHLVTGCKYLNFWLYDELINKNKSIHKTSILYKEFMNVYDTLYSNDNEICKDHIEDINEEIYNKVKNLLELYNHFKNVPTSSTVGNCFNDNKCADLYNDFIKECAKINNRNFCDGLDKFREIYNERMIFLNTCENVQKYLPSYKSNNMAVTILIPIIIILAIPFILFFLHKYTTFPSQLLLKIKKNARIFDDQYENTENFLPMSQSFNRNSENSAWNIAYHTGTR